MKLITKIIIGVLLIQFSCDPVRKNNKIIEIVTYRDESNISYPVAQGDSWIKYAKPTILTDSIILIEVNSLINNLIKSNERFNSDHILLRSTIKFDDGSESVIDYDGFVIKMNGKIYQDMKELRMKLGKSIE